MCPEGGLDKARDHKIVMAEGGRGKGQCEGEP